MGRKPLDLSNQKFGRLLVLKRLNKKDGNYLWLCKCDCGNECKKIGSWVKKGQIRSCGCLRTEHIHKIKHKEEKIERNKEIIDLWLSGATVGKLSDKFNITKQAIHQIITRKGFQRKFCK